MKYSTILIICLAFGLVLAACTGENPLKPSNPAMTGAFVPVEIPANVENVDEIGQWEAIDADSINAIGLAAFQRDVAKGPALSTALGYQLYVPMPTFYSQLDSRWSGKGLGFNYDGRSTIARYGCHLSCVAMLYRKWGYSQITPASLNDWSINSRAHYAFSTAANGDLIRPVEAMQYGSMSRNVQTISYDQIYTALQRGYPVVIEIAYGGGSHFMVIFAFDGATGRYKVLDPLRTDGGVCDLYTNGRVKSVRLYGYAL